MHRLALPAALLLLTLAGCGDSPVEPDAGWTIDSVFDGTATEVEATEAGYLVRLSGEHFEVDQPYEISEPYAELLDRFDAVFENLEVVSCLVGVHTDERGGATVNERMSEIHAGEVGHHLSALPGAGGIRFQSWGYGERFPLVEESTQAAWDRNKRIDIELEFANGE